MGILRCIALCAALLAPFQCASDPDPEQAMEDRAPEALWSLAERFDAAGDNDAKQETLRYLVERYPSSREAAWAERELGSE